jgi:hypothetical protein
MHRETDEEIERRLFLTNVAMREWAAQPSLPDPAYDPDAGWRLDQFAMHFEPDLVQERKDYLRQLYNPELRPKRIVVVVGAHGREEITVEDFGLGATRTFRDPAGEVHKLLLEKRFRVTGFEPGSYKAEPIPLALLEILHPIIETSELVERRAVLANVARRFGNVRVFRSDKAVSTKHRGSPEKYDYLALAEKMERERMRFASDAELKRYLMANLRLIKTGKSPKNAPDLHTVAKAIVRHGLKKFVQQS